MSELWPGEVAKADRWPGETTSTDRWPGETAPPGESGLHHVAEVMGRGAEAVARGVSTLGRSLATNEPRAPLAPEPIPAAVPAGDTLRRGRLQIPSVAAMQADPVQQAREQRAEGALQTQEDIAGIMGGPIEAATAPFTYFNPAIERKTGIPTKYTDLAVQAAVPALGPLGLRAAGRGVARMVPETLAPKAPTLAELQSKGEGALGVPNIAARRNTEAAQRLGLVEEVVAKSAAVPFSKREQAVRDGIEAILDDPEKAATFSEDARRQMARVVAGTKVGNTASWLGDTFGVAPKSIPTHLLTAFATGGGSVPHTLASLAVTVPTGLAGEGIGLGSTMRQTNILQDIVARESPLAKSRKPEINPAREYLDKLFPPFGGKPQPDYRLGGGGSAGVPRQAGDADVGSEVSRPALQPMANQPLQSVGPARDTLPFQGARFPEYATKYPPVQAPDLYSKAAGNPLIEEGADYSPGSAASKLAAANKAYFGKSPTPEAAMFGKARSAIAKQMKKEGYEPYYDPAKRRMVDPSDYPTTAADMTKEALPAKKATIEKYEKMYDTPEARKRIAGAFKRGLLIPDTKDWYAMKQLQDDFVRVLGPEEGKAAFKSRFADSMSATTGGSDPTANLLMSHYAGFLKNKGGGYPPSHQFPYPIGGQYAGQNMKVFQTSVGDPAFTGFDAENPKRFDFSSALLGRPDKVTMDEQMTGGLVPGMQVPQGESYGVASGIVRRIAEKAGVDPTNYQGVTWAGLKYEKGLADWIAKGNKAKDFKFEYAGPMINHINDAIERTHRLTGMPRRQIVEEGLIKQTIPLYGGIGAAGVGAAELMQSDDAAAAPTDPAVVGLGAVADMPRR